MILSPRVSGVFEVIGAFLWREGLEQLADCRAEGLNGARGAFSQQVFELGKDLFDGVQIRRVFRQEEQLGGRGALREAASIPPHPDESYLKSFSHKLDIFSQAGQPPFSLVQSFGCWFRVSRNHVPASEACARKPLA